MLHLYIQHERWTDGNVAPTYACALLPHVARRTRAGHPVAGEKRGRSVSGYRAGVVTDHNRAAWRASRPIDWADGVLRHLDQPRVRYCVRTESGCWYDPDNECLDPGEPDKVVVVDRIYSKSTPRRSGDLLVKAGVRLGGLLDQALGD